MGRVSQAQAQENRRRIVETAARLFRERGVPGVSVADVMAEVGLTHGGFYKQFASKDALVAEAVGLAFTEQADRLTGYDERTGHRAARSAFLDAYLSADHRDDPGHGCPSAGFGGDLAREDPTNNAKIPYARGVELYARWLGGDDGEDLAAVSTLVGAMVLARATAGTEISDRILAAAHAALTAKGTANPEAAAAEAQAAAPEAQAGMPEARGQTGMPVSPSLSRRSEASAAVEAGVSPAGGRGATG